LAAFIILTIYCSIGVISLHTELAKALHDLANAQLESGTYSTECLNCARNRLLRLLYNIPLSQPADEERRQALQTLITRALEHIDRGRFDRALATMNLLRDPSGGQCNLWAHGALKRAPSIKSIMRKIIESIKSRFHVFIRLWALRSSSLHSLEQ
jgi:hypothetical protein